MANFWIADKPETHQSKLSVRLARMTRLSRLVTGNSFCRGFRPCGGPLLPRERSRQIPQFGLYFCGIGNSVRDFLADDVPGAGTGSGQGTTPFNNNPADAITGFYIDASGVVHDFLRTPCDLDSFR